MRIPWKYQITKLRLPDVPKDKKRRKNNKPQWHSYNNQDKKQSRTPKEERLQTVSITNVGGLNLALNSDAAQNYII